MRRKKHRKLSKARKRKRNQDILTSQYSQGMGGHTTYPQRKLIPKSDMERKRLKIVSQKIYQTRLRKKMRRNKYLTLTKARKRERNQDWYKEKERFKNWAETLKKLYCKIEEDPGCTCGLSGENKKKIVNGIEVTINKYPWMALYADNSGVDPFAFCGGAIISDKYILTAAHCLNLFPLKELIVILGDHDFMVEGDTQYSLQMKVAKEIEHPRYNPKLTSRDIGLVQLEEKIKFSLYDGTILPICLSKVPQKYYSLTATVAGWGNNYAEQDADETLTYLNEFESKILWMDQCRHDYGYKSRWITGQMLCTIAPDPTQGDCQGDSGGPLFLQYSFGERYEQVGVVSWGIGCADPKYPGVYTKLSHHLVWIARNTKDSTYCSGG